MYAKNAKFYADQGLAVIPCGEGKKLDGKEPLVRWRGFQSRKPSIKVIEQWIEQFSTSNIGAVTGKASGITVIDVDAAASVDAALEIFGDTPLRVESPRGGQHLYFRYDGEKTAVKVNGLPIDIRAQGGLILLPPSINLISKKPYKLIRGDYSLLESLPFAKSPPSYDLSKGARKALPSIIDGEIVEKGQRNQTLFHWAKERALECDDMEDLLNNIVIPTNNLFISPPLPEDEVKSIVKSIWKYKLQGNLFRSGQRQAVISEHESSLLAKYSRALRLLIFLKQNHDGLRPEFYVADAGLGRRLRWDLKTVAAARRKLVQLGLILIVYQGGKGPGDASRYRFP